MCYQVATLGIVLDAVGSICDEFLVIEVMREVRNKDLQHSKIVECGKRTNSAEL